ncbi:MAG TPA: tetratricopeptide repeat protein [Phycisphaerales bacterium]|nr:tetratricopeptide repeat protein [Phycisphaerales bacterium]
MLSATTSSMFNESPARRNVLIGAAIIVLLTLIAYIPVMAEGGFIWDDDSYVTANRFLQLGWDGLVTMWTPKKTPQYYPVVFTTFWIENQLWGLHPRGYHVVNVLLHAINAVLVWMLARRLKIPWPWLVGAIWALHPVNVESVAWITERKNTLSAMFYLLAALAYLRFDDDEADEASRALGESGKRWWFYAAALGCFILALLSKSVMCSLPAALILMMLWQRKRLSPTRLAPLAPFFIIGLLLALNTAKIERDHVGATGEAFDFSIADRFLIASKALLFYPSKIIWPWPVMFIYPRWVIDDTNFAQYWYVAAVALIAIGAIIAYARGHRGSALALAFFAGTVFPALGFVNVYPMIFSFVADHFQYLASLGIIVLVVGALATLLKSQQRMMLVAAVSLPVLGGLTWITSMTYYNAETVWRDTLSKNEAAFMPHNNLATELLRRGEDAAERGDREQAKAMMDEADLHLERALQLKPLYDHALTNIADVRRMQGRYEEALGYAQKALDLILSKPDVQAVLKAGGTRPVSTPLSEATWSVGRLKELLGHNEEALTLYRDALSWNPRNAEVQVELARLLMKMQREDEAAPEFETLIKLQPGNAGAMTTLASIRQKQGRDVEARDLFARAAQAAPTDQDRIAPLMRLVRLLASSSDPNVRDTKQAVAMMEGFVDQTRRSDPALIDILASVLAADGRLQDAVRTADEAAALADRLQAPDLAKQIRERAAQYRMRLQPPTPLIGPTTSPR